jgi:hypothetical protein
MSAGKGPYYFKHLQDLDHKVEQAAAVPRLMLLSDSTVPSAAFLEALFGLIARILPLHTVCKCHLGKQAATKCADECVLVTPRIQACWILLHALKWSMACMLLWRLVGFSAMVECSRSMCLRDHVMLSDKCDYLRTAWVRSCAYSVLAPMPLGRPC